MSGPLLISSCVLLICEEIQLREMPSERGLCAVSKLVSSLDTTSNDLLYCYLPHWYNMSADKGCCIYHNLVEFGLKLKYLNSKFCPAVVCVME